MSESVKKEIKLFNKWSYEGIEVRDPTLVPYINLRKIIIPTSSGRHDHKKFWKTSKISIVERFINRLLAPGFISGKIKGKKSSYNSGKKAKIIKFIENGFQLIHYMTDENPLQVLIDAIIFSSPREETTRIAMGGISYASAVDISPQRRVDLGIKYLVHAIGVRSHSNIKTMAENVAQELISASKNSQDSRAVKRKDEIERIAVSAR